VSATASQNYCGENNSKSTERNVQLATTASADTAWMTHRSAAKRAPRRFFWIFAIVITTFTVFVLLEAFVIPRAGDGPIAVPAFTPSSPSSTNTLTTTTPSLTAQPWPPPPPLGLQRTSAVKSYVTSDKKIAVATYHIFDSDVYVANIKLSSAEQLMSAFASDTYGRNITQKPSTIATNVNAVIAVNGDFYGARSSGYVIRNGELYRDRLTEPTQQDLVIWRDGSSSIIREGDVSGVELMAKGALHSWSFGPALIADGQIVIPSNDQLPYHAAIANPRTAIAEIAPLHYLLVVVDGRTATSTGLTLTQLAAVLAKFEVNNAYNLDGGGTTTMLWNGNVINNPVGDGATGTVQERWTSDIIYS
jgi:exopolysaccharide biosynthesis protein